MIKIYQIARLESRKVNFKIEDNIYKDEELVSTAVKKYLQTKKQNEKIQHELLYPISLPVKSIENSQSIEEYKSYFDKNFNKFEFSNYFILPSIGAYKDKKDKDIFFISNLESIVFKIFINLLNDFLKNKDLNEKYTVYFDISGGINIYVASILEALRYFHVFYTLFNLGNKNLEIYVSYSEPIIGNYNKEFYQIYFHRLKFKTFFNISPISREDSNLEHIYSDTKDREELKMLLTKYKIVFNSINKFAPLPLYYVKTDKEETLKEINKIIQTYLCEYEQKILNSSLIPKIDKANKILLSLAFMYGVLAFLNLKYDQELGVSLEEIKEKFIDSFSIYNKIKISNTILKKEFSKIKNDSEKIQHNSDFIFLYLIQNYQNIKDRTPIEMRNFEAHAGFVNTVVQLRKYESKVYLRYDTQKTDIKCQNMFNFLIQQLSIL